ncbi:MAG: HPr family phosphocarrier protein [Rhodospirillaceae bacterium]|jgi:phosphocarrier protein HPr|nr:HPr family phosphocarrier protein [Rhodospirillaceae bacterium]MBT6119337.1 HPr family phosphocarrier protein [Rhodospirillaceae bacterium]
MTAGRAAAEPGPQRRVVTIVNGRGLHARAAAKFVKLAAEFEADVEVAKDRARVAGSSIMGLMMLAAGPGTRLELCAGGPDAAAALDALVALVERKFGEDRE